MKFGNTDIFPHFFFELYPMELRKIGGLVEEEEEEVVVVVVVRLQARGKPSGTQMLCKLAYVWGFA